MNLKTRDRSEDKVTSEGEKTEEKGQKDRSADKSLHKKPE